MGIVIVILITIIAFQHQTIENYEVKQSSVKEIGNVQNAHAKEENKESKENKIEVEDQYAKIITDMHITTERLRNQIARSSRLPRTPQVCTSATERTEIDWPEFDRGLREYREAVRRIITKGTEEQAALNAAKLWIEKEVE